MLKSLKCLNYGIKKSQHYIISGTENHTPQKMNLIQIKVIDQE
jgi:hypothetical protein